MCPQCTYAAHIPNCTPDVRGSRRFMPTEPGRLLLAGVCGGAPATLQHLKFFVSSPDMHCEVVIPQQAVAEQH